MGLTAITHHSSPYPDDYVNNMGNVGLEEGFQTHKRGLGNRHKSANRLANTMISRLQNKMVEAEGLGIKNPGQYSQHDLDSMIRKAKQNGTKTKSKHVGY